MRTPFPNMTFSPDVPSTALGPNEYNAGYNVETDVVVFAVLLGMKHFLQLFLEHPIMLVVAIEKMVIFGS